MTTHHTAQGLASLGRHGDTMLVHMSPHEVAGLNYLAKKQGTKLTVNPHTGLPEAFSLGGFFSSFLPTLAGMAFAPETGGFSMAPLLAGAATGAGLAAAKGENPLMGGLMGGLGGYGGGQLGPELAAAQPGGWVAGQAVKGAANPLMDTTVNTALNQAGTSMMTNPLVANAANNINAAGLGAGSGVGFMDKATQNIMNAGSGLKNIVTGQPGAWDAFKAAGGSGMKLAMPVGGAILGGLEPSDIYGEPIKPSDKGKYDPYATLNLGNDTGLRLVAEGGYIDSKDYAVGGTVTTGGLRDLYSATDNISNPQLSRDGYGIGRLNSLAQQQSMNQAQTMGYADGGDVASTDAGTAPPGATWSSAVGDWVMDPTVTTPTTTPSRTTLLSSRELTPSAYSMSPEMARAMALKDLERQRIAAYTAPSYRPRYAMGGPVSFADGGDAMKLQDEIAPINQTMGIAALTPSATTPTAPGQAMPSSQVQNMATALSGPTSSNDSIVTKVANDLRADPNYQPKNPIEAAIAKQIKGTDTTQQPQQAMGLGSIAPSQPMAPSYNPSVAMGPTYYAGMNAPRGFAEGGDVSDKKQMNPLGEIIYNTLSMGSLKPTIGEDKQTQDFFYNPWMQWGTDPSTQSFRKLVETGSFAKGGYLDGAGDGMSDSIPATIEGQQPARLADGEFVVPADVVSHIGNGSSKAGSKRLYAMLDRVRKARTGHTKQGKEINPNKYMPA